MVCRLGAIIWPHAGILSIGNWEANFSEISSEIHPFSFREKHSKMSSPKWRPFCLAPNVLNRDMEAMIWKNEIVAINTNVSSYTEQNSVVHVYRFPSQGKKKAELVGNYFFAKRELYEQNNYNVLCNTKNAVSWIDNKSKWSKYVCNCRFISIFSCNHIFLFIIMK